jgi:hypothetical protein
VRDKEHNANCQDGRPGNKRESKGYGYTGHSMAGNILVCPGNVGHFKNCGMDSLKHRQRTGVAFPTQCDLASFPLWRTPNYAELRRSTIPTRCRFHSSLVTMFTWVIESTSWYTTEITSLERSFLPCYNVDMQKRENILPKGFANNT